MDLLAGAQADVFVVSDTEVCSSFRGNEALELFLNTPENVWFSWCFNCTVG